MEQWEKDFENWWYDQVGDEGAWASLERLAAKNAYRAAFERYSNGVANNQTGGTDGR